MEAGEGGDHQARLTDQLHRHDLALQNLQVTMSYERELIYRGLGDLSLQVHHLRQELGHTQREMREASILAPMTAVGWVKLAAAVLIPISVLVATGSVEKAVTSSRLIDLP